MKSPCVLSDKSDRLILTIAFNDLCITECRKCRILMLASGSFNNTDCITGRSRGPSPNLQFIFFIKFFLKFHTICEIEIRIDFCYKFYLFIFFFMIIAFFLKKHIFPTLLKRIKVGEFSQYRSDSRIKMKLKTIWRKRSGLFFLTKSELFFISLLK